ncbi:MAG: DNA primase [Moraxellaceae bacterium]|nr:DNA primase [Moraxellaceae bacterium]
MIPESFIQEVLARVDIVDLIERYVPLKKGGANYMACCPFHNEKSPSFTVSPSKQFYHCFGCGAHGTAVGFLMEYAGMGFPDAIRELAGQVGMTVPEEAGAPTAQERAQTQSLLQVMDTAMNFYRASLKRSPKAIDYFKSRGLTGEVAARFQLGYAPDDWQPLQGAFQRYDDNALLEAGLVIQNDAGRRYDRFRDRVMFPIHDQRGNVIGFGGRVIGAGEPKYLNSPETPLFQKGSELYGLHQARQAIRESGLVVVTEGYMDVVALAQYGFPNTVAALGTATTPIHIQKLMRQAERIVFCFDGDKAGRKAAHRALDASIEQLADDHSIAFLFLPPEHDPDSYVREQGLEAWRRALDGAMPLTEFLLHTLKDDIELTTAEGRARLVHEAKGIVPRIPAPMLRLQMIRQIAQDAGLDVAEVERAFGLKPSGGNGRNKAAPPRLPRAAVLGPVQQMLRLLATHPDLVGRLPSDALAMLGDTPESTVLQALIDAHDDGSLDSRSLAILYERWRDTPQETVIADLLQASEELAADSEAAPVLLEGLLNTLRRGDIERAFDELQRRLASGDALSADEMQQYKALLLQKQKLKSGQTD